MKRSFVKHLYCHILAARFISIETFSHPLLIRSQFSFISFTCREQNQNQKCFLKNEVSDIYFCK